MFCKKQYTVFTKAQFITNCFSFIIQLQRNILASQPRVTKFKIDWDEQENEQPMEQEHNALEQVNGDGIEAFPQQQLLADSC